MKRRLKRCLRRSWHYEKTFIQREKMLTTFLQAIHERSLLSIGVIARSSINLDSATRLGNVFIDEKDATYSKDSQWKKLDLRVQAQSLSFISSLL